MDTLQNILPIIIDFLIIIILIVGIILGIKAIITMNKVDKIVDDVNDKMESLNGFFSVLDFITDRISSVSDMFFDGLSSFFGGLVASRIHRRKRKDDIDE